MGSNFIEEELVHEISGRRVHVLQKFADFEQKAAEKRKLLVESVQLARFLRTAGEFKDAIEVLIETGEGLVISPVSEHLTRVQKTLNRLRDDVDGKRSNVTSLELETARLLEKGHYASEEIQKTSSEVLDRWDYLLKLLDLQWIKVQKELESIDFARKCEMVLDWIEKTRSANDPNQEKIFCEIRKISVVWNEISAQFQQMTDPSPIDTENHAKVHDAWIQFQNYVDSLLKALDANERSARLLKNAEDVKEWMDEKEAEIRDKYSRMDVETSMKYRKTIEIEIKSIEQRVNALRNSETPEIQNSIAIEEAEAKFVDFCTFIEKWRKDLENAADLDSLIREAEEIKFWCSDTIEELRMMESSESIDVDQIAVWIETDSFEFNSWKRVVELFVNTAQKLLEKIADKQRVQNELDAVNDVYNLATTTSQKTMRILEARIKTINVEKLIFQTHQKAAHLVNVLQKNDDVVMKTEDVEKELRMNDGVAVRCTSVVEQIEHVEERIRQDPELMEGLSGNGVEQLNQLADMKQILKTSAAERKERLQRRLDAAYLLENCAEIREHTEQMWRQLREGRAKREGVQPIREQIERLAEQAAEEETQTAMEDLEVARENLKKISDEHERLGRQSEARKVVDRTEKFVERVHKWMGDSLIDEDEVDSSSPSQNQHLRRIITNCRHLISTSETYKKAIDERREELSPDDDESRCLLDGIQNELEEYYTSVLQIAADTEKTLEAAEKTNELNSHNEWINQKIKSLSHQPVWDCLLVTQQMSRRYEKDSEEIESRRKNINEVLMAKTCEQHVSIIDEIERNWSRMKSMFDELGGAIERMIKLFEYEEEARTSSEWLREKMVYAEAIEPKVDEAINRVMAKKLDDLADDVENYEPKIVETHALLEDALITPNTEDSKSSQVIKYKTALTRKQGDIESDYTALKRLIARKRSEIGTRLQEADVLREIADLERWIVEEEAHLDRLIAADSDELQTHLDDVTASAQNKRANLTDIKCTGIQANFPTQKIDDAFSALDVFSFELERIRQRALRASLLKSVKSEVEDVIHAIQTTREKIDARPSVGRRGLQDLPNIDGDLETLRTRVVGSLEKAREVRTANADLAPQVYDLEERLEKEYTELSRSVEERKKRHEKGRLAAELEGELIDMEQWVETFNEEVIIVTGGIHDGLGVQVGLESIDTWREELSHRVDQIGAVKNLLASMINSIGSQEERNVWLGRVADVSSDLLKARKTIDAKQDELSEFANILGAERDCERLHAWLIGKRRVLENEANGANAETVIRKMNEIEKMMMSRAGELEQLRTFLDELKASKKPSSFKSTELEEKFEKLDDEWNHLEEELRRREVDLNESMTQLLQDEQFSKIQKWIEERNEELKNRDSGKDLEKMQKRFDKLTSEINEYAPLYEDFLNNERNDDEKVTLIREMWSSLIETTTIKRKTLAHEVQRSRLLELLDDIGEWLADARAHAAVNFSSLYATVDAEKSSRRLTAINELAGEKDDVLRRVRRGEQRIDDIVEGLRSGIGELKVLVKENCEDLEVWKSLQEVVRAIDDEICWFKEISVIVSSADVGHDSASLDTISRKHQRLTLETERRKQKVAKIVDRTTELISRRHHRPSLDTKFDEVDEKVAQMTELIENNTQIAEIRTNRLEKWAEYFSLIDELNEKEHVLEHISDLKNGSPEVQLTDVERKLEVIDTICEQAEALKELAERMSNDEVIRTRAAENAVDKLREKLKNVRKQLESQRRELGETIRASKFVWKCDTAVQCIRDQEEKVANLVRQTKATSNFENAAYYSTCDFVENYTRDTFQKLVETSKSLADSEEAGKTLAMVEDRLNGLKTQLGRLAEKIGTDGERKLRVQSIQDEYSRRACELANWLEQAEEDVADVVWFQTKESSEECRRALVEILDTLRTEKVEVLGELEIAEVELAELNEQVGTFTWHSGRTLAARMERLDQTIVDRVRIVDDEIGRHLENETICEQAAATLTTCRRVLQETKMQLDEVHLLGLDEQKARLVALIEKLGESGMVRELERWRSVMGSRYIFDNKFSAATPHGVLVDTCHSLELMSSMLRSVEQSIAERNSSGVTEKQLREFELAFEYFDREKKGWLEYERFELCMKSQGYEFTIETASVETMMMLDPTKSGHILKTDYMRWMVKNETTNILDDHSAIEKALQSLDARKLSDSMSRKEAEFFMRKIAKHTETFTEHVHLEYKDFVNSFY